MDASRAQAESNPILEALDTAQPALAVVSRAFLQEVDPLPGLPANAAVQSTAAFRAAPGHGEALREGLAAARERASSMGVEVRNYSLRQAGANTGLSGRAAGFESWAQLAEFEAQTAADGGGPLVQLLRSANVVPVISGVSVAV